MHQTAAAALIRNNKLAKSINYLIQIYPMKIVTLM